MKNVRSVFSKPCLTVRISFDDGTPDTPQILTESWECQWYLDRTDGNPNDSVVGCHNSFMRAYEIVSIPMEADTYEVIQIVEAHLRKVMGLTEEGD